MSSNKKENKETKKTEEVENKKSEDKTNQAEQNQTAEQPKEDEHIKLEDLSIEQLRQLVSYQGELNNGLIKENEELIKKNEELRKLLGKNDTYLDQLVAIKKDFDSYKQRMRFDAESSRDEGLMKAIERVLPFIDTLEKARVDIKDGKAFDLIYRQFCKVLFEMGVEEIEVIDKPFNPQTANAISELEVAEDKKGNVVDVYQKGFIYKGKILRYAQVIVGK